MIFAGIAVVKKTPLFQRTALKTNPAPLPVSLDSSTIKKNVPLIKSLIIKPRDNLTDLLSKNNVPFNHQNAFLCTFEQILPPKIYPGDSLVLEFSRDSILKKLSLLSKKQCWYTVVHHDTGLSAQKRELRLSTHRYLLSGTLESSLYESIRLLGGDDLLTCKLADIFAWDINFFIDPRKGDTFQVIYTKIYAEGNVVGFGSVLAARFSCNSKDFYAIGFADSSNTLLYYDKEGRSVQKEFLKAPLNFSRISSSFSLRRKNPVTGIVQPHLGIDYAAPTGTPVYASADGRVRNSGWDGNYGRSIIISHGGSFTTCYGHLSSISPGIRQGVSVKQGQMIGRVGSTGRSTGPHLDYRMKSNNRSVNPLTINLPSRSGILPEQKQHFQREAENYCTLFDSKFKNQNGCFILDTILNAPADSGNQTLKNSFIVVKNGTKSGT